MALDVSGIVSGQVIQAAHITQFNSLLTGTMVDQAVTLKNQLSVGGNQGIGAVPLTIQGVSGQTADYLDITAFGGGAGGVFKITSTGALTFGFGVTVSTGGLTVSAGGLTVTNGGLTVTAGGATITAGGLTITAGGLTVAAGNVAIGGGIAANRALYINGPTITASGGSALGIDDQVTLAAAANGNTLFGMQLLPTFTNAGAFTSISEYGVHMSPTFSTNTTHNMFCYSLAGNADAQASSSKFGFFVGAMTGANANNYGVYINAPSGASGVNEALHAAGQVTVTGGLGVGIANPASTGINVFGVAPVGLINGIGIGSVVAGTASAGGSGAAPAQVLGYLVWTLAGTGTIKIPYYSN